MDTENDPVDYWEFTLERPSYVQIYLEAENDGAVVDIYDADHSSLPIPDSQTPTVQRRTRIEPGTYYARIRSINTGHPYPKTYKLMLEGLPIQLNAASPPAS